MTLSLDASIRIADDVVFRELDGEAVVLDLGSGTYFGLDDVGTRIWQLVEKHQSLRLVLDALGSEYEVALPQLGADLIRFIDRLHTRGLVTLE